MKKTILNKIGIHDKVIKIYTKEILVDNYSYTPASHWYPHPPCFIPLFVGDNATHKGILYHWFIDRQKVYAEYSPKWGYIEETARTDQQFLMLIPYKWIEIDGELTNFTQELGLKLGFSLNDLRNMLETNKKSINSSNSYPFISIEKFFNQENTPLTYLKDTSDYKGDFPSSEIHLIEKNISLASSYEICNPDFLKDINQLPAWLNPNSDKKHLFDDFFEKAEFGKAWLTLNSTGWKYHEVAEKLVTLAEKTNNPVHMLIAENWIERWKNSNYKGADYAY